MRRRIRFRTVDHTADVGLIVWGESLEALFENAACGMFYLMYPGRRGGGTGRRLRFEITDREIEDLLVAWLRELLYIHETERMFLSGFDVRLGRGPELEAVCIGRRIDTSRRQNEIKLVTYHGLKVQRVDGRYRTRIIFDI